MQARFHTSWAELPASLQFALEPILSAENFPAMLTAEQVKTVKKNISGLDDDALAFALLPLATACALTPISHFNVGAIARGKVVILFRCQYGVPWCTTATDDPRRAMRGNPCLAAW